MFSSEPFRRLSSREEQIFTRKLCVVSPRIILWSVTLFKIKNHMNKNTIISIIIASVLIISALILTSGKTNTSNNGGSAQEVPANNVSVVDGKQIIEIKAKGGYLPRKSIAKAGIQTILRFNTNGTFDCSSSVRIPEMNISKNLSPSGITDIDLGIQKVGTLNGSCGMGMYPFEIEFQ